MRPACDLILSLSPSLSVSPSLLLAIAHLGAQSKRAHRWRRQANRLRSARDMVLWRRPCKRHIALAQQRSWRCSTRRRRSSRHRRGSRQQASRVVGDARGRDFKQCSAARRQAQPLGTRSSCAQLAIAICFNCCGQTNHNLGARRRQRRLRNFTLALDQYRSKARHEPRPDCATHDCGRLISAQTINLRPPSTSWPVGRRVGDRQTRLGLRPVTATGAQCKRRPVDWLAPVPLSNEPPEEPLLIVKVWRARAPKSAP